MKVLLAFLLVAAELPAQAVSVVCNGGDGAPYWAYTMQECLNRARTQAGSDAKDIAREAERAEKRARDARKIGDRIAADRREFQQRSPETQASLGAAPYVLAAGLAGLAAGLAAQQRSAGEAELKVPRTQGELAASQDPSLIWKRFATYEAERATHLFRAATGGVEAAQRFNELSVSTKRRGESMLSLDRGQAQMPITARSSGAAQPDAAEKAKGAKGAVAAKASLGEGGEGEKLSPTEPKTLLDGKKAAAGKAGGSSAGDTRAPLAGSAGGAGKDLHLDKGAKPGGKGEADGKDKSQAAKQQADGLDLFERAMNLADGDPGTSMEESAEQKASPVARASAEEDSLFARITLQYRRRESLYFSPFGE